MRLRVVALVLLFGGLPLLAACEEDEGPQLPTVTGSWEGTSDGISFSMSIFEDETGSVAGTGITRSSTTSFPYDISGTHGFPVVRLQMALLNEPDVLTLEGFVTFDSLSTLLTLEASVTGGGFEQFPVQLTRK